MSRTVSAAMRGRYPLVAAVALVMTVVTAMGVAIAMVVGGSESLTKL